MDLSSWIERHADFTPAKTALRFEGRALTYADLHERIVATAALLKDGLGVGRGDRVAHLGHNSPAFLELLFACARLGALFVPLNWRLAPPEHAYILRHAGAAVAFVEPDFTESLDAVRRDLPDCRFVALGQAAGWPVCEDLMAQRPAETARNPHVGGDSPLLIVYTSGTTGRPKGAVLTQDALFWNAVNSTHMHDLASTDHVFTALPLFHVGGLNNQTLPALHAGATVTLHRRFDPGAALAAIVGERPTLTVLVPATMQAMIGHPDWAAADLSSLRLVTTGSTVVPRPLIEAFHDRGVTVVQIYGCTETAPIAIYLRPEDAARKIGSTGKPALHCDVRLVDDAGCDLPAGAHGEILVRGPNVMREYWGDAEATAAALTDGWFHTGDVARRDDEGYYWITDRKTDVIISGSENIYPAELEAVLDACPEIGEAAVVGRPDARWGEVPVAVVVRKPGSAIGPENVLALFADRLARYKHPHDVLFVEALPRNVMGKVEKFRLRDMVR